jgi:cysteine dioxygenase
MDHRHEDCPYQDEKTVPAVDTLTDLIRELHNVFSFDKVNVDYVKALLSAYQSNPLEWRKFAKFDTFRYTRNLVDSGNGKFNLMILCWGEGHGSSIHDHSNADCFVKVLDGTIMETMFDWPTDSTPDDDEGMGMTEKVVHKYSKNGVTYINDSMGLHRVENPSHADKTVSLHLYCPPFDSCQIFDQRTGTRSEAKVTFWSKYGKRTPFGAESNECSKFEVIETPKSEMIETK